MLLGGEVRGELARIHPARSCCRRAELLGLLHGADRDELRTLDHATARTAVHLAASLGIQVDAPRVAPSSRGSGAGRRRHLSVALDRVALGQTIAADAPACDRRAFLRGALLGTGSLSFTGAGPHVEFVQPGSEAADRLEAILGSLDIHARRSVRRGRHVVYLKGTDEIVGLLGLLSANRGVLELETQRVGADVRARLNRLLNAEEANLGRTVRAADRQLHAIEQLERDGTLAHLSPSLRETALTRRRMPDADLDALASTLGVGRSAVNHRLRRLVELSAGESAS
jgi:cell division protein WhiA